MYKNGSFDVAARFSEISILKPGSIGPNDVLSYGTSDPTINPSEILMTAMVAEREKVKKWIFFNYPLSQSWVQKDVEFIFAPYGFPYPEDPFRIIPELGLNGTSETLVPMNLQQALDADDPLLDYKLCEIVEIIKELRDPQYRSFLVANFFRRPDNKPQRVYGTKKDKFYWKRGYKELTLREILGNGEIKLGGAVIYFIFGCYCGKHSEVVGLIPHNTRGDVWSAYAAGVRVVGGTSRLYPVGGVDLMTEEQWQMYYKSKLWHKAPVDVVRRLLEHPFCDEFRRRYLDQKRYCPISYDPDSDSFRFVEV